MGTVASRRNDRVRYAVVGIGYISQAAVLPAFEHAGENSELAALVSGDPEKQRELGERYHVRCFSYEEYDRLLASGAVDAVYIALPNSQHRDYAERAARAGIHVLCEKPMAITEEDCLAMIHAAEAGKVKLMIAYRLHFEEANLRTVERARSGEIGEPRIFSSIFSQQVKDGDIRLRKDTGGGALYDMGIYCINAARYLFRDEPVEVMAFSGNGGDPRFREVDEAQSCLLRFPGDRLATLTCSFGAADVSAYRIVGTKGDIRMDPAYELAADLVQYVTIDGKTKEHRFRKRDQFAPELLYFSRCVLEDRQPEPDGWEGLADVRIIRALLKSAEQRQPVKPEPVRRERRPNLSMEMHLPAVKKPHFVDAESPSGR